jgi:hypothetical protein
MKKHKPPKQQARKSASKIAARLAEAKRLYSEFCKLEAEMKARAARVVDYIARLTNVPGTARQQAQLYREAVEASRFSSERLGHLAGRMWLLGLRQTFRSVQDPRFGPQFLATAQGRDFVMELVLELKLSITRDPDEKLRIQKLRDFWDDVDKGVLASKKAEREALALLRQLHAREMFPGTTRKQRAAYEAELSRPLLDAAKNPECEFELALAKAKKFRTKRQTSRFTEEGNLRADLAYFGILGQLQDKTFPDSLTIMEKFDPNRRARLATLRASKKELDKKNAKNLERNWRKLLDECRVTPRRLRKRGPRKMGTS